MAESAILNLLICFALGETYLAAVGGRKKIEGRYREVQKNELTVVVKAKDLCTYAMAVTQKPPKQFRFTPSQAVFKIWRRIS